MARLLAVVARRVGFQTSRELWLFSLVIFLSALTLQAHLKALLKALPELDYSSLSDAMDAILPTNVYQTPRPSRPLLEFPGENVTGPVIASYALGAPNRSLAKNDLTMATHASTHKMERIKTQIEQWGGPVSLAMYITSKKHLQHLTDYVESNPATFQNTSIHVVMERLNATLGYPHNQLRNLAVDNTATDFFLAMDVDFVTTRTTYPELRVLLNTTNSSLATFLENKGLLVLPAFERFMPSELNHQSNDTNVTIDMVPNTKQEVLEMLRSRQLAPFHLKQYKPGHGPTDFQKWYDFRDGLFYPITYSHSFEPYVVACRHNIPRYNEEFRGFGKNKISWFLELHYAKYTYAVLRDFFVIHLNHPTSRGKKVDLYRDERTVQGLRNEALIPKFQAELTSRYGTTHIVNRRVYPSPRIPPKTHNVTNKS